MADVFDSQSDDAKGITIVPELPQLFENTRQTLLEMRGPHGHWEGELSSSALSTAIAVIAIEQLTKSGFASNDIAGNEKLDELIEGGLQWLASHQNADGGWGDTVLSRSNISTTSLVWAAFAGHDARFAETVTRCGAWLSQSAGSLEPPALAQAIADRYGIDRTFSVPILTTLAIRNRLGSPVEAWKLVPQLPFELAAFPREWFARLKMPVVSYALPALIAIGQARHHHRPSLNPILRLTRNGTRARTLRVLETIQPTSGGFLEATPLTSFVVMSLIEAGNAHHPVVSRGVKFLIRSVREDGSWPIDTNLATWVTTLAVNALSMTPQHEQPLSQSDSCSILNWLLKQQYRETHPYTNAAPGGWAWTDLTGGVPDADDTPGATLALWNLSGRGHVEAASAAINWLLDLQNSDGGMPTFCRGWGTLPFDRSSADITAHGIRAWSVWHDHLPAKLQRRIHRATARGLRFLSRIQRPDGAWAPLWFGNQHASTDENLTYGTSRVILALVTPFVREFPPDHRPNLPAAMKWLLAAQNADGGWGGGEVTPSSIEETALAIEAICAAIPELTSDRDSASDAIRRGLRWLAQATDQGRRFPPSPIGFYFAKLWYYERLYPVVYTLAAAGRALTAVPLVSSENSAHDDALPRP